MVNADKIRQRSDSQVEVVKNRKGQEKRWKTSLYVFFSCYSSQFTVRSAALLFRKKCMHLNREIGEKGWDEIKAGDNFF